MNHSCVAVTITAFPGYPGVVLIRLPKGEPLDWVLSGRLGAHATVVKHDASPVVAIVLPLPVSARTKHKIEVSAGHGPIQAMVDVLLKEMLDLGQWVQEHQEGELSACHHGPIDCCLIGEEHLATSMNQSHSSHSLNSHTFL